MESNPMDLQIADYVRRTAKIKTAFQNKLWTIFTETTGYRPDDICIVEQRITEGTEMKTIFYFDLKHRHQQVEFSTPTTNPTKGDEG